MFSILPGLTIGTILFILYVIISPDMKGMAFRPDDTGFIRFTPLNIVRLAFYPLVDKNFWIPNMLISNWFIYLFGGVLVTGLY